MGKMREVETPMEPGKPPRIVQMTNLEWALQFVLWKVQELIYHNRKTDMCGVVLAGTEGTRNIINDERPDEYLHVTEYIDIAHPTPDTLAKISALKPSSDTEGDPLDGVIVALNAQNNFLASKPSWSRKLIIVTDGENPIATSDYKSTIETMNQNEVITSVVGVDFDDAEFGYQEPNKSENKVRAERFWRDKFVGRLNEGIYATCEYALQECARPESKEVKSAMGSTVLRVGDPDEHADQSITLTVRTSKATAIARPPSMKKFGRTDATPNEDAMDWEGQRAIQYAPVKMRTDLFIKDEQEDKAPEGDGSTEQKAIKTKDGVKVELDDDGEPIGVNYQELTTTAEEKDSSKRIVTDEHTQIAYKYGSTYIPVDKADFESLKTEKGMDIVGFIPQHTFRREWAMGEVYYIWGDTESGRMQIAFSSIVQAMLLNGLYAVIRMVTGNNYAPKIGIAVPRVMEKAHCLLWIQMPFAEDHRNYSFESLDRLFNKKGNRITKHQNLPTEEMMGAMSDLVDSMDLMEADQDEEGNRIPYFDTIYSYNPALHRVKQALFHAAVSPSLSTHPLGPPHPELVKYFDVPKRVAKLSKGPVEVCKKLFDIKQAAPRAIAKKENALVDDRENEPLLLGPAPAVPQQLRAPQATPSPSKPAKHGKDSDAEDTEEDEPTNSPPKTSPSPKQANSSPRQIKSSPSRREVNLSSLAPGPSPGRVIKEDVEMKPEISIGTDTPLEDFKAAIARSGEDVVSDAVTQLGEVIKELVVVKHFPNRRKGELLEAMKFLRATCIKEDEIHAWNEFLRELKEVCLESDEGNRPFWDSLKALGPSMSLIGKSEVGEKSAKFAVKDAVAVKFFKD